MICYHGTANYSLEGFIKTGAIPRYRRGFKRKAFCASLFFPEAALFALRKTPANDLTQTGIVVEFEGDLIEGKNRDFVYYRDRTAIRDEGEVVIFSTRKIKLVAYWEYHGGKWERKETSGKHS